jgi:hypothetical protein
VSAVVDWFKPVAGSGRYSAGFNTALTLSGTKLTPPAGIGTWQLTLSGGELPSNLVRTATITGTGAASVTPADGYKLTLRVTPTTGKFTGSFLHPATKKTVSFNGLFLQPPEDEAGGFFLGPNTSGAVTLEP